MVVMTSTVTIHFMKGQILSVLVPLAYDPQNKLHVAHLVFNHVYPH